MDGIKKNMLLFPYAKDIEYIDGKISFTLQFFNDSTTTDVEITFGLDNDLQDTIEKLFALEEGQGLE